MNTPRNRLLLVLLLAFVSSNVFAQGPLTPPAAPTPTMKTLDQVEARTPIGTTPFTINASGSYYLTGNLSVAAGNAITISADQVTLDLNGFSISSTASPAAGTAVLLTGIRKNITIKNGHIRGTTTFSAGAFTTGGFLDGVSNASSSSANLRVADLNVLGMGNDGIDLLVTNVQTFVSERCNVTVCGGIGIRAGVVRDSSADTTGDDAINGDIAINCSGETVNTLDAGANGVIGSSVVQNCRGISVSGTGVVGLNITNSRGTSSSGTGLNSGGNALNCDGFSTSGSFGLTTGTGTASSCRGRRDGGIALNAGIAIGCTIQGTGIVSSPQKFLGTP